MVLARGALLQQRGPGALPAVRNRHVKGLALTYTMPELNLKSCAAVQVPLEGFANLQGMHGPQHFQIHKSYGSADHLPQAHTCFNQLDLPQYTSYEQTRSRLLLAFSEGSEGFGFG